MARNYTLAPFRPAPGAGAYASAHGNWTAETTLYSLDLNCEPATQTVSQRGGIIANSTNGCSFDNGLNGNLTIGKTSSLHGQSRRRSRPSKQPYL